MTKVVLLGASGMLGSAIAKELAKSEFEHYISSRAENLTYDVEADSLSDFFSQLNLDSGDYVINAIGVVKSRISSSEARSVKKALNVNSIFPAQLADYASKRGLRVIMPATDCVFSGRDGRYFESSPHDAHDVYGKTKSLAESLTPDVMHLRASLIGPELRGASLFFEWVRQQPIGSTVSGFKNHFWNGVPSFMLAEVIMGIIESNYFQPGVQHLIPKDEITKDQLIRQILVNLGRKDVVVESFSTAYPIDRTLATLNPEFNMKLFAGAGYKDLPSISDAVRKLCESVNVA